LSLNDTSNYSQILLTTFFIPSCFIPLLRLVSPFTAGALRGDPGTPAYASKTFSHIFIAPTLSLSALNPHLRHIPSLPTYLIFDLHLGHSEEVLLGSTNIMGDVVFYSFAYYRFLELSICKYCKFPDNLIIPIIE